MDCEALPTTAKKRKLSHEGSSTPNSDSSATQTDPVLIFDNRLDLYDYIRKSNILVNKTNAECQISAETNATGTQAGNDSKNFGVQTAVDFSSSQESTSSLAPVLQPGLMESQSQYLQLLQLILNMRQTQSDPQQAEFTSAGLNLSGALGLPTAILHPGVEEQDQLGEDHSSHSIQLLNQSQVKLEADDADVNDDDLNSSSTRESDSNLVSLFQKSSVLAACMTDCVKGETSSGRGRRGNSLGGSRRTPRWGDLECLPSHRTVTISSYHDVRDLADDEEYRVDANLCQRLLKTSFSTGNFGWKLVSHIFRPEELRSCNYRGNRGKKPLCPKRLHAVEHAYMDHFKGDISKALSEARNAINQGLRNISHALNTSGAQAPKEEPDPTT